MRRLFGSSVLVLILSLFAFPSTSFAQQALSLSIGGFIPRSEDACSPDDVLVNNLDFLSFRINDFKGASVNGEWLVGLNEFPADEIESFSLRRPPLWKRKETLPHNKSVLDQKPQTKLRLHNVRNVQRHLSFAGDDCLAAPGPAITNT